MKLIPYDQLKHDVNYYVQFVGTVDSYLIYDSGCASIGDVFSDYYIFCKRTFSIDWLEENLEEYKLYKEAKLLTFWEDEV